MIRYRPLIGVTTQSLQSIDGIPEGLPNSVVMNQRYYLAATAAGAVPVLIPLLEDDPETLREIYDRLDGILIPGGVDMDPVTYGEQPHEKLGRIDPSRDRTELMLAAWAVEERKPLLGLCRGLQVLNVACGGTLFQDIEAQLPGALKHDYFPNLGFERDHLAHDVELSAGSRLRDVMERDRITVNSMHHQGIKTIGAGLRASAVAPDGIIEAIELDDDGFVLGVQWHPEVLELTDPHTRQLFRAFVDAASHFSARPGK
jgi:putative glutamine amidotransferase